MNKLLPIIVAVVSASGLAATACTVNSTTNNNGNDSGATGDDSSIGDDSGTGGETSTGDDSSATDGGTEAATPSTNVRFANWSPDAPAGGYDFCLAPHGTTTWSGPLLGQLDGDSGTLTLTYPTVTTYFQVDAAQYDLEIVAAGATDCTTPVGSAITTLPNLTQDDFFTIAFVGDSTVAGSDSALTAFGFQDDPAPTGGTANLRFLNAAPSLNSTTTVDFGQGSFAVTPFNPLETSLPFATLATAADSDAGTVDSNGYISVAAITSATQFSARLSTGATSDLATASGQTLAANSSNTLVLIGGKQGSAESFLVCNGDTGSSSTTLLSNCTKVTQ